MRPKRAERRFLVHQVLSRHRQVTAEEVSLAYDVVDAAFRKVWHDQHVTWTVRQRLGVLLEGMRIGLPEEELAELVRLLRHELTVRPRLVEGVRETLDELKGGTGWQSSATPSFPPVAPCGSCSGERTS
jgi:hypothetical protein